MKKNFIIWIRVKSIGKIKIEKLKDFIVTASDEFDNIEKINVKSSNAFKINQAPTRFEIWFNIENALNEGFYPTKFEFDNFKLPIEDFEGKKAPFEIEIFKVKSDGEIYHNIKKRDFSLLNIS